jgi:hypothetical protein
MDQTIPNCASKFLIKTEVNKVISPFVSICSGGPQRPKRPRPRDENRRDEVVHPEGGDGENQGRGADRGPARRRRERGRVAAGGRVAERAGHPTVGQFIIGEYSLTFQRNSYFEMYTLQDHPSSDSFYDSDFADGETTTTPQVDKQQDKDSEGSQQDQFENAAEVDGEWGRQRTRSYTLCLAWYRCTQLQANVCSCRFSRFLVRLAIHQHRDESRQKDTVLSLESLFLVRSYFGIMLLWVIIVRPQIISNTTTRYHIRSAINCFFQSFRVGFLLNLDILAMLEQERQRIEQLTAGWDDPTQVDWGTEELAETTETAIQRQESTPSIPLLKCTALYSYTVKHRRFLYKKTDENRFLLSGAKSRRADDRRERTAGGGGRRRRRRVVEGAELQGRRGLRTAQLSRRGARTNGVHSGTGQPDIILVRGLHRRQRRGASGAVGNESIAGTSFGDISGTYGPAPPPFSHCPNRSRTRFPKRPPFRTAAPSTTTTAKAEKSSLSRRARSSKF